MQKEEERRKMLQLIINMKNNEVREKLAASAKAPPIISPRQALPPIPSPRQVAPVAAKEQVEEQVCSDDSDCEEDESTHSSKSSKRWNQDIEKGNLSS